MPSAPQQCRPQQTCHQNPLQSADVVGSQAAKYSWQHQLQGVLEFDRVHFANESIVVRGSDGVSLKILLFVGKVLHTMLPPVGCI